MSEMIERVARAICKSFGDDDPDRLVSLYPDSDEAAPCWREYIPEARAAIEAMREPTSDMLSAFNDHCDETGACLVKTGYRAMIDAALAPQEE